MAREKIIDVVVFGVEIGKIGYDVDQGKSFFQYNPEFLDSNEFSNLFPFICFSFFLSTIIYFA